MHEQYQQEDRAATKRFSRSQLRISRFRSPVVRGGRFSNTFGSFLFCTKCKILSDKQHRNMQNNYIRKRGIARRNNKMQLTVATLSTAVLRAAEGTETAGNADEETRSEIFEMVKALPEFPPLASAALECGSRRPSMSACRARNARSSGSTADSGTSGAASASTCEQTQHG